MITKILNTLFITIISFILIGCNYFQDRNHQNTNSNADKQIFLQNSLNSNGIEHINLTKPRIANNSSGMSTLKVDRVTKESKGDIINTDKIMTKIESCSIVIPSNDKPVDNLSTNTKQSDKKVIAKQPIIKDEPEKKDRHTEPEAPIQEEIIPEENTPPEVKEEDNALCDNAWFDKTKPCDYIPDNLKPTDELGRSVPHFLTSIEAWNWGEAQIKDDSSKYSCRGFTRMDGYQNDGKQFFFAYLKVCEAN